MMAKLGKLQKSDLAVEVQNLSLALTLACKDLSYDCLGGCPVTECQIPPKHCSHVQDGTPEELVAECERHLDGMSSWRCWVAYYCERAAQEREAAEAEANKEGRTDG